MNVSRTLTVFLLAAGFAFTGLAQQTYIINSLRYSPELEKYAENGNATAQNNLGVVYQKGSGVEADLGKAIYWFTKGAEGGNDKAMVNLGAAYLKGTGVDQNIPEAVRLFEKAALQMSREEPVYVRTLLPQSSRQRFSVGLISAGQPLRHRRCV